MARIFIGQGFIFHIWPHDHEPPHLHIFKGGDEVEINIGDAETPPSLKNINGMKSPDIKKAIRMVAENQELFLSKWEEWHGNQE